MQAVRDADDAAPTVAPPAELHSPLHSPEAFVLAATLHARMLAAHRAGKLSTNRVLRSSRAAAAEAATCEHSLRISLETEKSGRAAERETMARDLAEAQRLEAEAATRLRDAMSVGDGDAEGEIEVGELLVANRLQVRSNRPANPGSHLVPVAQLRSTQPHTAHTLRLGPHGSVQNRCTLCTCGSALRM